MNYVLYGTENLLINEYIDKLKKENNIENVIKYNLEDASLEEILLDCNYKDMFNENKMIIVNNASFLTPSLNLETENLQKYLNNPNENTILIFVVNIDKLDNRKKIVKIFEEKGKIEEFNNLTTSKLIEKIKTLFNEEDYKIDDRGINELINRCKENYNIILNEIEKLKLYKINDKTIDYNDVCLVVSKPIEDNIFKIIDFVSKNDKPNTLKVYTDLINLGEDPIKLLVLLANQFRLMYQVMILKSYTDKEIAVELKVHPYRVKLAREKNILFSKKELEKILDLLSDLDLKIKSGTIDKYVGLELFLMTY